MEIARLCGFVGGVPERSKGADCKSAGSAFEGSNPSPSTSQKTGVRRLEWSDEGLVHADQGFLNDVFRLLFLNRGCSSMVEQKPSKLMTRVRFPSPAPSLPVHALNERGRREHSPM